MKLLRSLLVAVATLVVAQAVDAQQIVRATYGARGRGIDVTGIVQGYINRGENRFYVGNSTMGGDPAPGVAKTLSVTYRTGRGQFSASAREDSWIQIGRGGGGRGEYDGGYRPERPAPDLGAAIGGAIAEGIIEGFEGRTELKFRNRTGQSLQVYALSRHGHWRWVTSLPPGARYSSPAAPGQSFIVTDEFGRTVKQIRAGAGTQWVSIP
ncbi:MAG: hypothetical protein JSR82_12315 [Verrucomicrobia bacterium]|nr:hypothetical protein [Verrucomicrobiota bacterium]